MIIIGLGNPGPKYHHTRHNFGYEVVEKLAARLQVSEWKKERDVVWVRIKNDWIIKPQSFMNNSGPAVADWMRYKNLEVPTSDMLLVHDDVDFELGDIRQQQNRSSAGHRGVQSIFDEFGTEDFSRLRLGIGRSPENHPTDDFVLEHFTPAEMPKMELAVNEAVDRLAAMLEKK